MEALILLEAGDEIILTTKDTRIMKVVFHDYDFENGAMIVNGDNELQAFEFDEINCVEFKEPITGASMINNRLPLSQQAVDRWRDFRRIQILTDGNFLVGDGVLTASTRIQTLLK